MRTNMQDQTDDEFATEPWRGVFYDFEQDHWLEFDKLEGGWIYFHVHDADRPPWALRRIAKDEWADVRPQLGRHASLEEADDVDVNQPETEVSA